jgi:hypothetical protein
LAWWWVQIQIETGRKSINYGELHKASMYDRGGVVQIPGRSVNAISLAPYMELLMKTRNEG